MSNDNIFIYLRVDHSYYGYQLHLIIDFFVISVFH